VTITQDPTTYPGASPGTSPDVVLRAFEQYVHEIGWDQRAQLGVVTLAPDGLLLRPLQAEVRLTSHPPLLLETLSALSPHRLHRTLLGDLPAAEVVGFLLAFEAMKKADPTEWPLPRSVETDVDGSRRGHPDRVDVRVAYLVTRGGEVHAVARIRGTAEVRPIDDEVDEWHISARSMECIRAIAANLCTPTS
jgi:hypothetical protein